MPNGDSPHSRGEAGDSPLTRIDSGDCPPGPLPARGGRATLGGTMDRLRLAACVTLAALVVGCATPAAQTDLAARVDAIINPPIKNGTLAGASVAVTNGGQTLLLERVRLRRPRARRADAAEGYLRDWLGHQAVHRRRHPAARRTGQALARRQPDHAPARLPHEGNTVTIRQLLNHTSGIKGYTEMPEFREFQRLHRPRQELVALFSGVPFEFTPGAEQTYNNSAFFLLGLIVEKVSGTTYESFVKTNLFDKVGMPDSYYCSEKSIRKNHAHGYDTEDGKLVLKGYLDHLWPYSAGSLCSNTTDLTAWTRALHGGKVLSPSSYREMTTPGVLSDGTRIRYGMGISVADIGGRHAIAHGGGISGFLSEVEVLPRRGPDCRRPAEHRGAGGAARPGEADRGPGPPEAAHRRQTFSGDLAAYAGTFTGHGRGRTRGSALRSRRAPSPIRTSPPHDRPRRCPSTATTRSATATRW